VYFCGLGNNFEEIIVVISLISWFEQLETKEYSKENL
jgi:hypothetical protein